MTSEGEPTAVVGTIRLLHAVHDLSFGGLQRVVLEISGHPEAAGLDTHVLSFGPAALTIQVPVHRAPAMTRASMLYPRALVQLIRQLRPDVVHAHSGVWYKVAVAARLAGVRRLVYTEHGRKHPDTMLDRVLGHLAARLTYRVVAVSGSLADHLRGALRISAEKIVVIPNGVDTSAFRPRPRPQALAAALGIHPGAAIIGSVGRLDPVKRYDLLLRAFAETATCIRQAGMQSPSLVLVGDGEGRDALAQLAAGLGVADQVRFVGWQRDVTRYYALFDVFALSSVSEGTPVSLLEAMASAVPVVVTDVGGMPDVLGDALRDQLVPSLDGAALARKLSGLLLNRELRHRLGALGRARIVENYSLERMVGAYLDLYSVERRARAHADMLVCAE